MTVGTDMAVAAIKWARRCGDPTSPFDGSQSGKRLFAQFLADECDGRMSSVIEAKTFIEHCVAKYHATHGPLSEVDTDAVGEAYLTLMRVERLIGEAEDELAWEIEDLG